MVAKSLLLMCSGFICGRQANWDRFQTARTWEQPKRSGHGYYADGKMSLTTWSATRCQRETASIGRPRSSCWTHCRKRKNFPGAIPGCNPSIWIITTLIGTAECTTQCDAKD